MDVNKKDDSSKSPAELELDLEQDYDELNKAAKKGLFGRFNSRFNDALQSGRSAELRRDSVAEIAGRENVGADDIAIRRARHVNPMKMIIPEGVIIEGSLTGGSETEIGGRIEGDITVDGNLYLSASALVTGNVRAGTCRIDGLVEGKVECSKDLELGASGRLNADVVAGRRIHLAGQVHGSITTPGTLRLVSGSRVEGNLRTRSLVMEEGAFLDGACRMRAPAQKRGGSA